MNDKPRILAFSGSSRRESLNQKALLVAARGAEKAGGEVTIIRLSDYLMPIYDGDLEQRDGPPQAAATLRRLMVDHHGFLVASPEYNGSITPLLKNALDWVSRPTPDRSNLAAFDHKVVGLIGASPSSLGAMRSLMHIRWILSKLGALVLPDQVSLPSADKSFDDQGRPSSSRDEEKLLALGRVVTETAARLHLPSSRG
ncbi:MAG: NAD(P)H-dependent oxidoreductase [Bradymonadales bacterium]|nr:NAD(P)H-dependent oxidoreductase [Bradymonadales bacterium]